ncbi:hypothetical protein Emag_003974 [Eimeria magna]
MAIDVLSISVRPSLRFLSVALRGWSRRQRQRKGRVLFLEGCVFSLCLALLKCSLSASASFNGEDLHISEEASSTTGGRPNYSLIGSDEGFSSVSLVASEHSLHFPDDADAVDAPQHIGANFASTLPAAQNAYRTPTAATTEEIVSFKKRMRRGARVKGSAAASLLLAFLVVSVVALVARRRQAATALAEGQEPQFEEPLDLSQTNAEAVAAAADAKLAYLVKLQAGASELARILRAEEAVHILEKITSAVNACKTEAEAIHQDLDQEEHHHSEDHLWLAGLTRLIHFYSTAVEGIDRLLRAAPACLRAQAEAANDTHFELLKTHARIERICDKASMTLEKNIGETLLRISQSAVSESLKQLHAVHETSAHFTYLLALRRDQYPGAAAKSTGTSQAKIPTERKDLDLVLEQAVAAARVALRGRARTGMLLRHSTELLEDTKKALLLLSRSRTAWLALDLTAKSLQMKLTCSELQTIQVPDAWSDAVNLFKATAQIVESYAKEVEQLQQQLLETTDAVEAMSCTRRAEQACELAAKEIEKAPPISVTPPASLHSVEALGSEDSAATGLMILDVAGKSALVQQEEQSDDQRQERLLKLRAELRLEKRNSGGDVQKNQELVSSVLEEVKSMLREQARSLSQTAFFRELYGSWEQVVADADRVSRRLDQALERLDTVEDMQQLHSEAKEILSLKVELADLSVDAVYHAADCKAWAVAERALSAALHARAKAAEALTDLQQQEQQQQKEQKTKPINVSAVSPLVHAVDEIFKKGNVASALDLVAKLADETGRLEDYVQNARLSCGESACMQLSNRRQQRMNRCYFCGRSQQLIKRSRRSESHNGDERGSARSWEKSETEPLQLALSPRN